MGSPLSCTARLIRCAGAAELFRGRYLELPGASHWGLVLNRRALERGLPDVLAWIDAL